MKTYKTDQRHVAYDGREFHFVSYEGQRANTSRGHAEVPATWCLMSSGKRWEVMPQVENQDLGELDRELHAWLENHFS